MRPFAVALLFACLASATEAFGQAGPQDPSAFIPRYSVALGYNNIRANAPPASCGCFDMNGLFVSGSVPVRYWLSAAAEVTGGHANNIGPLGQNLTLTTYTAGPQVTWRGERLVPYAQALFGVAHGSDSYFPAGTGYSSTATSFAFTAGGGLDLHLNHRFAVRVLEAQFLHTGFPNSGDDAQRHLMLGAGIVFKFHSAYAHPESKPLKVERPHAMVPVPPSPPLPPPPPPPPPQAIENSATDASPVVPSVAPVSDAEFHEHIQDIFFDYDSANLRPESQQSVQEAVVFLNQHPEIRLAVAGYADERGSVEYNFELSKRRAEAAAHALLAAGIPEARLRVVSYGKTVEVCTEKDDVCWQRNRRAAFSPAP